MIINNANIFGEIKNIVIEDGKIISITDESIGDGFDAKGKRVIPGLIDLHTHGCIGYDTMDGNFEPMCRYYAEKGTTSFLPTTMTMDTDSLLSVCNAKTDFGGANILGFHFEGPYVSVKYKGAQNEKYIKKPNIEEFRKFKNIKMITVAPEAEGCLEFIEEISKECVVSIGHTDCDYETAIKAIEKGASSLTHTFNAMAPLHHRNSGPIGAGVEKGIYAQIICDGFHISKPVILAAYKMFGPDRLTLISDSIRPAGLPDGEYESGGLAVRVENKSIRLLDGVIAGSYACLWNCVKKAVEFGISFEDAVKMATETPARCIDVNKGKISVGYDADLLIVNDDMDIETVIINGEIFK